MSKKLMIIIVCLIIALISLAAGRSNLGLDEAEAMLISRMLESETAVEVFAMEDGVIGT